MRTRLALSLGIALATGGCAPRAAAPPAADASLARGIAVADSLVAAGVGTLYPGAVLLVAQGGRVVHERAHGHAQLLDAEGRRLADPPPVRTTTLFDLASVTKVAATTTSLLLLVDRGRVELDAPIARYLPELRDARFEGVTVRHLLQHASGLVQWQPLYYQARTPDAVLQAIARMPLQWRVGEGRHYSDLGFMLLGHLVQRVAGEPLDRFARRELFEPLGMRAATFRPDSRRAGEVAATETGNAYERQMVYDPNFGYDYAGDPRAWDGWRRHVTIGETNDGNAWYAHGGWAGHAGLFATASDLHRLLALWLGRGVVDGRRIARAESVERFLTRDRYGHYLGWMAPAGLPEGSFAHTGFTGTWVLGVPARGLAVVLLTNRQNMGRNEQGYFPDLAPLQRAVGTALTAQR
ncbi:MAG TPA: serine hydrolase domain-containing protein [Gemmatimonadaceae bacterium]|nr:serine hydrolase domain-containing protein [Gemmatimonadaceae bacterium]